MTEKILGPTSVVQICLEKPHSHIYLWLLGSSGSASMGLLSSLGMGGEQTEGYSLFCRCGSGGEFSIYFIPTFLGWIPSPLPLPELSPLRTGVVRGKGVGG